MDQTKEPVRKAELHCHVQSDNKLWLKRKAGTRNVPIGRLVDDLVSAERLRERDERDRTRKVASG